MRSRTSKLFRGAALGWLIWRVFGPETSPRFRGIQERPLQVPGRSVIVGQREFFVREAGAIEAPPVVLLHGWVYDSIGTWYRMMGPLADDYRVIAVDQRNHGRSDPIRGEYAIEDVADEVAGVLEIVGTGPAAVVGYSMGGMVAQELARRHPRLVERLVLAGTAAQPIPRRRLLFRLVLGVARALGRVSPADGVRISYEYLVRTGAVPENHARWLWEALLDRDATLYAEGGKAIWYFDSRSWVKRLDVPTLVIIPTEDQLVVPTAQYELASLLPKVEIVELVGARHEATLTHSDEMVAVIKGFLG